MQEVVVSRNADLAYAVAVLLLLNHALPLETKIVMV
jgi:hypothetical protein